MTREPTVLIVERDPDALATLQSLLKSEFPSAHVWSTPSAQAAMAYPRAPDVLVACYGLDDGDGISLLREARRKWPKTARILLCRLDDPRRAVEAVNEAAVAKLLMKPVDHDDFLAALRDVMTERTPQFPAGRIPPNRP